MQLYGTNLTQYTRLKTRAVKVGDLYIGGHHPIRVQTMTTTDTLDTEATVAQTIRCIEAGAELVRITAPSKKEAEHLQVIKEELRKRGYTTPLVADIHFTPNAAEIAARIVEKVRVNPGNYIDKKKFEQIDYTDAEYAEEIERIRERFTPLVLICKEYGTAMRIGTNHGSLSDRIMSRYGDTPMGMVESAMEFLRIARESDFHQIILSMKSSNPQVMVQAYRLLVQTMLDEFGECYPLHLGVTEAGDGEDGRIKSAIGIGTLLEDGIGDTIRVSLTEDPEFEIPVCQDLVKRYQRPLQTEGIPPITKTPYDPFSYQRRKSRSVQQIGGQQVPVVIADLSHVESITAAHLQAIGYRYDELTDKWSIADAAADFVYTGNKVIDFALPGTLQVILQSHVYGLTDFTHNVNGKSKFHPIFDISEYIHAPFKDAVMNFVMVDCYTPGQSSVESQLAALATDETVVLCLSSQHNTPMLAVRRMMMYLEEKNYAHPVVLICDSPHSSIDEHLIHLATETGALLLEGMGDGICLGLTHRTLQNTQVSGRTYMENKSIEQFLNNTAFSILQATRTRISKTEYISCPSCGRTLFELQETTAKIRAVTHHLKGLKIAIMGCIVNGPGEMADADFGYVGSGPGKITLYKGKEVVKRNVDSAIAVEELINLLKENEVWIEP